MVIKREESAVYLVPCDEIYHKQFFDEKIPKYQKEPNCYYKTDISKVKLLNNLIIINSNKKERFYKNFSIEHTVPPTFYINEGNDEARVRQINEFQEDIDKDILNELINTERLINKIVKYNKESKSSILVPEDYRKRSIYNIAKCLKENQKEKKVRFNEEILYYKLICPNVIYYALYPKVGNLVDTNDVPIRTLGSDLFCNCSKCRIGRQDCLQTNCENCFGRMADKTKVMLNDKELNTSSR